VVAIFCPNCVTAPLESIGTVLETEVNGVHTLRPASILSFVALAATACPIALADASWPAISGDVSTQECADALKLARAMFNSDSRRLYAPPIGLDGLTSELALRPHSLDISGGHALQEDPAAFEQFPQRRDPTRSIYWERTAQDHVRIAVWESPMGWQGDVYSVYVLPAEMDKDEFLAKFSDPPSQTRPSELISGGWRPPLVFQIKSSGRMWFIDVGQPYTALGPWQVYRASSGPLDPVCTIQFRPAAIRDVLSLLPEPVASFAQLVDQTIGPGLDEGTMQYTARLRINVQHVWANVAQRPWAVSEADVYNSRQEVDAGLKTWSRGGHSHLRVYRQILAAYPIALHSLCAYYERTFSLSKDKAQPLAEYVLDIALRANYIFSNGGKYFRYENVNNNPWKLHD
jgi:hypothetical protein